MAIDKTDGSGASRRDRKDHWAFYASGHFWQVKGPDGKIHILANKPVGRQGSAATKVTFKNKWLKIGGPVYKYQKSLGSNPKAVRTGKRPPAGTMPDTHSTKPGSNPNPNKNWAPGDNKAGGGGGGGGNGPKTGPGKGPKGKGPKGPKSQQTLAAVDQQLGGTSPGQKLGPGYAGNIAGLQFDAPIHDLKTLIDRLGPQNKQAIQDLGNWFGSVQTLNQRAGGRNAAVADRVAGDQESMLQGLMASLGGGANEANTQLAGQGEIDAGYQRVLGGIEEQYHNDMDPILAHAEAQAKEREQRLNLTQMQDYQLQLADLMGQKGQAKAGAQMEVDKYNNELAQQWFQNKLAKLNAALGAQAAGVDLKMKQAQLKEAKKASGGVVKWRSLNPAERDDLLMRATGARQREDGTIVPTRTMQQARAWLTGALKNPVGSGKNPGLLTMLFQYYH